LATAALQAVPPAAGDPGWSQSSLAPAEVLVNAIVDASTADVGWLAWLDGTAPVIVRRELVSPIEPAIISEFPEPPEEPTVVDESVVGPWSLWCRGRGIKSAVVVPVVARGRIVGTVGVASALARSLGPHDVRQLALVASLAVHTRTYEARLAGQRRLFSEVSRSLDNALALDRAIRQPPTYREIARAVGDSLDASYCLIAIHDSRGALTVRAAGGHRPPHGLVVSSWPLVKLHSCSKALREQRAVVLRFGRDPGASLERSALFSPTTRVGVILPFFAGPRTQGVLIIGEERHTRVQALSPERVAILELIAGRIAHILRISRRLEYERLAERRRQRQLTVERQRMAREVHDRIGQALTGLLAQVRCSLADGQAGKDQLQLLEQAARAALDGARALAYGVRQIERGIGPLEDARSFAEMTLRAAQCRLSWTEERAQVKVAAKTLREVSQVIKESVTNIVRHAKADLARIRIEYPEERIRVLIQDNGIGFSFDRGQPNHDGQGLGLVGCSERLARVGGVFDIRPSPKGGTLVLLEAPRH
jgi:signal transduction histidine kinase